MDQRLERCYAGWLAKLAGIRLGAPVEGWTYEKICREIGEIDGYVTDLTRFAADDDSNGPMIFIRALNDYSLDASAEEIGKTWLNYTPYEHGMFWWGGYGVSTEHTAYDNLANGIPAPRSGSIAQNGATVAEQIGGQIFIDTWGLVFPGNPEKAAEFAKRAASVSHDGNGVYGAMYIAAAIAMAYEERDIKKIVLGALDYIPDDCEYARVVRAVAAFYDENPDNWRACFQYVYDNWGYDRYPGSCHIIPNTAVMILGMLYGEGDFDKSLNICCNCGWDTDCNVGNIATILGVMVGLEGIDYDKWLKPINDGFAVSSVMGSLNYMDAPWCARYLFDLASRLMGEGETGFLPGARVYDFELPGSTHSFEAEGAVVANAGGCLKCDLSGSAEIFRRTYHPLEYFMDDRYAPGMSPELYPGQRVTVKVRAEGARVRAYVRDMLSGKVFEGAETAVNGTAEVFVDIPALAGACIERAGILAEGETVYIDEMRFSGSPDYSLEFRNLPLEQNGGATHRNQFTRFKGLFVVEDGVMSLSCCDRGAVYTGDVEWEDYALEADITPMTKGECALIVRAEGALRSISVALLPEGKLAILRDDVERTTLAEIPHGFEIGKTYKLRAECVGSEIRVIEGGVAILSANAGDRKKGAIGFGVRRGARMLAKGFAVRPIR